MEEIKLAENIKKYELPESNILELDENSIIRQKNSDYYKGLKEEGIDWPIEIQGGGRSFYNKKEFEIAYPVGDVFLSFAITAHELGHLRQGEINPLFADEELGSPSPKKQAETEFHPDTEQDAWQRGLERIKKHCPEYLKLIDNKFQKYKKNGKFSQFKDFEEFYKYVVSVSLRITSFNDKFEDDNTVPNIEKGRLLGKMIKKDELTNDFFNNQEQWRTGEKADRNILKEFVKKMAIKIAEEAY
ncbi:MAG: hypothetical protein HYV53_04970 [Parcubacteria group bacterium]|nr:hypothetical protein [Parcubacteria group bacterium]